MIQDLETVLDTLVREAPDHTIGVVRQLTNAVKGDPRFNNLNPHTVGHEIHELVKPLTRGQTLKFKPALDMIYEAASKKSGSLLPAVGSWASKLSNTTSFSTAEKANLTGLAAGMVLGSIGFARSAKDSITRDENGSHIRWPQFTIAAVEAAFTVAFGITAVEMFRGHTRA